MNRMGKCSVISPDVKAQAEVFFRAFTIISFLKQTTYEKKRRTCDRITRHFTPNIYLSVTRW